MSRARCRTRTGSAHLDGDPRRVARAWAAAAEVTLERAKRTRVTPLVDPAVWKAAADPETWGPDPGGRPARRWARILGGWPARLPRGPLSPTVTGTVPEAVGLWDRNPAVTTDPVPETARVRVLRAAGLGGIPGAWGDPRWSQMRRLVEWTLLSRDSTLAIPVLWRGALACESLRTAVGLSEPIDPWWRMVGALMNGPPGDGGLSVTPHGYGLTVRDPRGGREDSLLLVDLVSRDPRVARVLAGRLGLLGDGAGTHRWDPDPVVFLLAPLAACGDRDALRLLGRELADQEPVVLALRAAGVPVDPGGRGVPAPHRYQVDDAPVIWWRRILNLLVRAPDRPRAVAAAEAAWVRLVTGT